MMKNLQLTTVFCLVVINTLKVEAEYQFVVDIQSIENRGGRCADEQACNSGEGCCESTTCAITTCQYSLHSCKISSTSTLLYNERYSTDDSTCRSPKNFTSGIFERSTDSGITTSYFYKDLTDDGLKVFMELLHNQTVLIDRFIIVSGGIGPTIIKGMFGLATMEISTITQCGRKFCGRLCSDNKENDTCTCEPGFTGEDCSIEINECEGASSNMECIDQLLSHVCICLPGFTGPDCQIDVDECSEGPVRCNSNGKCVNNRGSFQCECNEQYTGEYCESKLESFTVEITFHSFTNLGGRCADIGGTCANGSGCCDDEQCSDTSCNYMFLFCERARGTTISYARSENRGNCNFTETGSYMTITGDSFSSSIYGIRNPIVFKKPFSPINTTELYIELIDDDHSIAAGNNELIDRFVVPITGNLSKEVFSGIFGLARIFMSINVHCSDNFFGEYCIDFKPTMDQTAQTEPTRLSSTTVILITLLITAVILLLALLAIVVIVAYSRRRKLKTQHTPEIEMRSRDNTQLYPTIPTGNSLSLSSARERLESIPNTYQLTQQSAPSGQQMHEERRNFPYRSKGLNTMKSNYERIADIESEPQTTQETANQEQCQVYSFTSKSLENGDDDDYDYESPYWEPSNVEKELLSQLKQLKVPSALSKDLQELDTIGCGAFGTVVKGIWNHKIASEDYVKEEVAVKKIEGGASEEERVHFLKEAAIMGQFNHPNIIRIMGIVANNELEEYKIIMEFIPKGNLRGYLPSLDKSCDTLLSQLLAFSRQIASGMNYLAMKGYAHRDLAARNILVSKNSICKICDFGLSRDIHSESFYLAHGGKIPVKWAAPESVNYRLWSTASDVWSYGCVLYEIWSLGYKPFHNCNNAEAVEKVSQGSRLSPPPGCPRVIYELMINCWNIDSEVRPSFCQILSILNEPEYKIIGWSSEDKATYTEESRTIGGPLQDGVSLFLKLQNTYKKF